MTKFTKLAAATIQLDRAIELFLAEDFLCAMTLGGAAEDILGALTRLAGNEPATDFIVQFHQQDKPGEMFHGYSGKQIMDELNRPRNAAKHADKEQEAFEVDVIWACQMLMRAIPMARDLGYESQQMADFHGWISAHPEITGK